MLRKPLFIVCSCALLVGLLTVFLFYALPGDAVVAETGHFRQNAAAASTQEVLNPSAPASREGTSFTVIGDPAGEYSVYQDEALKGLFATYEAAHDYAKTMTNAAIKQKGVTDLLWHNYPRYAVYTSAETYRVFDDYKEATAYADGLATAYIYDRDTHTILYEKSKEIPAKVFINNVPHLLQLPELARGCEVTSLAMLIQYMGGTADKMTLAAEVEKNTAPNEEKAGTLYRGHPNIGFVGDMYSFNNFGYGVYHKPIYRLLSRYFPKRAVDLSGALFQDLYPFIVNGTPVWVVVNTLYEAMPPDAFEQWHTPEGVIDITWKEHAVLITGYDEEQIYFHDPLGVQSSAKKADFIAAWEQMGRQAVTLTKE